MFESLTAEFSGTMASNSVEYRCKTSPPETKEGEEKNNNAKLLDTSTSKGTENKWRLCERSRLFSAGHTAHRLQIDGRASNPKLLLASETALGRSGGALA